MANLLGKATANPGEYMDQQIVGDKDKSDQAKIDLDTKRQTKKDILKNGKTVTGKPAETIVLNPPDVDISIGYRNGISESSDSTAVMAFGRYNPPTVGHEKLINKVKDVAKEHNAMAHVVASHSEGTSKDPLPQSKKIGFLKKVAGEGVHVSGSSKDHPSIFHQASKLHSMGHKNLIVVAGSDRVKEYQDKLSQYNGKEGKHGFYKFKSIKVVSAGERDPDAEGAEGMSASKLRAHARAGETKEFKSGLPKALQPHHREIMAHIRAIKEEIEENFMDGKNPQDKGDMARHGLKGKSITQLKKIRSSDSVSPRKKQLAHWYINMHKEETYKDREKLRPIAAGKAAALRAESTTRPSDVSLKHRVSVTVSDPQHSMASKRKDKIEKRVRVLASDEKSAVELAKDHYKRQGYKVHDANWIGIHEEQVNEISMGLLSRYKEKAGQQASAMNKAIPAVAASSAAPEHKKAAINALVQKGNKRFSGILKATNKQFAKSMKKEEVEMNEDLTKISTDKLKQMWNKHKDQERPSPTFASHLKKIGKELQKRNALKEKVVEMSEAVTVKKQNYSWGKMVTVHHGSDTSYPLHPEHQAKIKALKPGEKTSFKDETNRTVHAEREDDKVHLSSKNSSVKTTVSHSHFTEQVNEAHPASVYRAAVAASNARRKQILKDKEKQAPFEKGSEKKGEITDKSGAKHTSMSRAKHLARLALNKKQIKENECNGCGLPEDKCECGPDSQVKEEANTIEERVITLQQRRRRALQMKRLAPKLKRARQIAAGRIAGEQQLQRRVKKLAKNILRRRFAGQRGGLYQQLGPSDKLSVDTVVDPKVKLIRGMATRLLPRVKQAEVKRFAARQMHKKAPSLNKGIGTMFQSTEYEYDTLISEMYESVINQVDLTPDAFSSLVKKSQIHRVDLSSLLEMYRVGFQDADESNLTKQQQAFNTVNSFLRALEEGENKQVKGGDPCWSGYQMVGMKTKNGKKVPNCVPASESYYSVDPSEIEKQRKLWQKGEISRGEYIKRVGLSAKKTKHSPTEYKGSNEPVQHMRTVASTKGSLTDPGTSSKKPVMSFMKKLKTESFTAQVKEEPTHTHEVTVQMHDPLSSGPQARIQKKLKVTAESDEKAAERALSYYKSKGIKKAMVHEVKGLKESVQSHLASAKKLEQRGKPVLAGLHRRIASALQRKDQTTAQSVAKELKAKKTEMKEEGGAGFEGTNKLVSKYKKDTPGESK